MKRGQKPTPIALRVLEGNRQKRRIPENVLTIIPAGLPDPPAHLDPVAREEWGRVAPELFKLGILTELDRAALAGYCDAYSLWARAETELYALAQADGPAGGMLYTKRNGNKAPHPLVGIAHTAAADMVRFAAEFGMTPCARARLAVSPSNGPSKFDGLVGPRPGA